jgi:ribosomal protein S18 acetylase RimI-like enzyme
LPHLSGNGRARKKKYGNLGTRGPRLKLFKLCNLLATRGANLIYFSVTDVIMTTSLARLPTLPVNQKYNVRLITKNDYSLFKARFGADKAAEFIARLLEGAGAVALAGDQIAAYSWLAVKPRKHEGEAPFFYDIVPAKGYAYLFDSFVEPAHRRQGLGRAVKLQLMRYAIELGATHCFSLHDAKNQAILGVVKSLGFNDVGRISYHRIGGYKWQNLDALKMSGVCI